VHPVFVQTIYYAIVMCFGIFIIALLQKGFLFPYLKVRASFGRLVLVKIRSINRDYFRPGKIHEGYLLFKDLEEKKQKRIALKDSSAFYKCLAVNWIDLDEMKNCIVRHSDNRSIDGFDAIKYQDLLKRALMRPTLEDKKEKIMLIMLAGVLLACVVIGYLAYQDYNMGQQILTAIKDSGVGSVVKGVA